jgi:hypothetical protein
MTFKSAFISATLIFANFGILNAQPESVYRLPAGTQMHLKMDVELSSKVATVNDTFTAVVTRPVTIRDTIAVPVGTVIEGRVRGVTAAQPGGDGKLDLVFESLRIPNLPASRMDAEMAGRIEGQSSTFVKVLSIVGGTVAGAVLGAAAKGSTGPAIGAGAGAGIGTAVALFRKGKNVRIREDQEFDIVLKRDVVLPVLDY